MRTRSLSFPFRPENIKWSLGLCHKAQAGSLPGSCLEGRGEETRGQEAVPEGRWHSCRRRSVRRHPTTSSPRDCSCWWPRGAPGARWGWSPHARLHRGRPRRTPSGRARRSFWPGRDGAPSLVSSQPGDVLSWTASRRLQPRRSPGVRWSAAGAPLGTACAVADAVQRALCHSRATHSPSSLPIAPQAGRPPPGGADGRCLRAMSSAQWSDQNPAVRRVSSGS